MFDRKNGLSPLIAIVLLMAFIVSLISIIINWGFNLDFGENKKCEGVSLQLKQAEGLESCYGGSGSEGYINFAVQNAGQHDIDGIRIWLIGKKGTQIFDLNVYVPKNKLYEKKDKEILYNLAAYGPIEEVQFIPKVRSGEGLVVCFKDSVKAEKIGQC